MRCFSLEDHRNGQASLSVAVLDLRYQYWVFIRMNFLKVKSFTQLLRGYSEVFRCETHFKVIFSVDIVAQCLSHPLKPSLINISNNMHPI